MENYNEALDVLNGRNHRKLENNTYLEKRDENTIAVKLHGTDVVTYKKDGSVILETGGWYTVTTKDRINKYSPVRVYQQKGEWFIKINGEIENFIDGVKVELKGIVLGLVYPSEVN